MGGKIGWPFLPNVGLHEWVIFALELPVGLAEILSDVYRVLWILLHSLLPPPFFSRILQRKKSVALLTPAQALLPEQPNL